MFPHLATVSAALLIPLAVVITYYDVRYRRIPNVYVVATLVCGIGVNSIVGGWGGLWSSVAGCGLAFGLMLLFHIFGAMGAGDVKLFAAIGSVLGLGMVLTTFVVVVMTGGVLAVVSMVRARAVKMTMARVLHIFVGLLPGWEMPRYEVPADRRHTIPYGVAIMLGSLISLTFFRPQ